MTAEHPAYGVLRPVTSTASVLLADNPGEMTLDGTNTWVLRAPGATGCVVVDPGPEDEQHLRRVAACGPVEKIVLTHGHPDHAGGVRQFAALVDAPVLALDPELRLGSEGLADGDVITAAGLEIRVLTTPGHTEDSLCLRIEQDEPPSVLTGDTILGRGTTVVSTLGDYLRSLRRLAELPPGTTVLPGHGPELPDAGEIARGYLAHREQRLDQVRAALAQLGAEATARQVVEVVYADVDQSLWWAAEWSVRSQLDYLRTGR
ncbi:MBL fold metallo-hydrolase [Kutzneria viridogrisea]|uniref:Beta-lactamase domain protein n=2 Tax=Kutzneria TaxID=43356 RepID=W5VZI4_9PSEU|nr:MBL fold metallo-hydrolase [Kutzneria albida]AHH93676.1 beta-lactamase domain protein [Kutzneria albida DSM 43870]MBA8931320.1 glyoxylase-like metal-dependent hydrolase (beta-lactamase superfamily II) [Kutzneria viridogrisea]